MLQLLIDILVLLFHKQTGPSAWDTRATEDATKRLLKELNK